MIDPKYKAQADLLLRTIRYVAKEKFFALKGRTAASREKQEGKILMANR